MTYRSMVVVFVTAFVLAASYGAVVAGVGEGVITVESDTPDGEQVGDNSPGGDGDESSSDGDSADDEYGGDGDDGDDGSPGDNDGDDGSPGGDDGQDSDDGADDQDPGYGDDDGDSDEGDDSDPGDGDDSDPGDGDDSDPGDGDEAEVDLDFTIDEIDGCGFFRPTCREATGTLTNDGDATATNVVLEFEVFADGNLLETITVDGDDLAPGESDTRTVEVDVDIGDVGDIENNDGNVRIETTVTHDDGTAEFTDVEEVL